MRIGVGIGVFAISAALVAWTHFSGAFAATDLYLNLATELLGIVVTLLLIDVLLERRRQGQEAKKTAIRALNEVDHAIWVWLGGQRAFDMAETLGLLANVESEDVMAPFTENLFLGLGATASYTIKLEKDQLRRSKHLRIGLEHLCQLMSVRDGDTELSPKSVSRLLTIVVENLANAAEISDETTASTQVSKLFDASLRQQEWRHFGEVIPKID